MTHMTFAVHSDMHAGMRRHSNIKWSEVVRQAIQKEIDRLHSWDKLLANSKLTEQDAIELGREIRHKAAAKSRKMH